MTQLNISLSDSSYDWVTKQVKTGKISSSDDYLQALINKEQQHQTLQQAITEGLESGISQRSVAEITKEARMELKTG